MQDMPKGAPTEAAPAPEPQAQAGGAKQLVTDTHDNMVKLMELFGAAAPEMQERMGALIQGFEALVDELGQPASAPKPQGGNTPMEAGSRPVQPVM